MPKLACLCLSYSLARSPLRLPGSADNQFFTLLLLRLLDSLLPLLLPPPLLWLLLQLPAAKHHGPKGRTESKMYVSRGRNVLSEILQKACRCYCHGRCSSCCRSSRQQNTMALKDEPSPKYHGPQGRTESKIYVSRGRNVPSEILQNPTKSLLLVRKLSFSRFLRAAATGHGCCSGCCRSSRQQNTMALKHEPSPKYTFPGAERPF